MKLTAALQDSEESGPINEADECSKCGEVILTRSSNLQRSSIGTPSTIHRLNGAVGASQEAIGRIGDGIKPDGLVRIAREHRHIAE